jgi:hypothetical protein
MYVAKPTEMPYKNGRDESECNQLTATHQNYACSLQKIAYDAIKLC